MKIIKQYDNVKLKDGREGAVVEIFGNQDIFLVDVGSSPEDGEIIEVIKDQIIDVVQMDNFKIIYRILKHLEASLDCEHTDIEPIKAERLGINHARWRQLIIMLQEEGYINGIVTTKVLGDDRSRIVEPITPVITLKGLEYLSENAIMKKAANVLKGIKDITPGL